MESASFPSRDLFTKSFGKLSKRKKKPTFVCYEDEDFLWREDFCTADNGFLLGDNTEHYTKPSSVNERFHTVKCYPSVIATEPLYQPIMNGTDNNVTNYIIQIIPQQSELCVMMLS